mgnify:CR=1 FL=1
MQKEENKMKHNPRITCADGFNISVQGSSYNYATPREDNPPNGYTHVECGFPSTRPKTVELRNYAELRIAELMSSHPKAMLQWQMPEIERGRPKGMALDHEGNIVVVEPHYSRINHFTPKGRLLSQLSLIHISEPTRPERIA